MARKSEFEQTRFFFNEYKRFPFEKVVIPFIVIGALVGLYFAGKAVLHLRSPEYAAEQIMTQLQAKNTLELSRYIAFTDEQEQRLDFGGGTDQFGRQITDGLQRAGFEILTFEIGAAQTQGDTSSVPITGTYREMKSGQTMSYQITLPLQNSGGRWRFTTEGMARALNLPATY